MISVGRICVKTAGREAGRFCVVVDVVDDKFVMVTGPRAVTGVKRRKCNIEHVEPTPQVIKFKKGASDDEVVSAYKKEGIFKKLGTKEPTAGDMQKAREAERKRAAMAKEKAKAPKKEESAPAKEEPRKEAKAEEKKAKPAKKGPAKHAAKEKEPAKKKAAAHKKEKPKKAKKASGKAKK
jgi:large subunit ribosomal protein L14e